ncbi:hypothetical protein ScPMuIL_000023 [Solemya velum]
MERRSLPVVIMTCFWGFVGIVMPVILHFSMRNSQNKGVIQLMLMMTAACCYLFWLCAFLFQLNPLIGPQLKTDLIRVLQADWQ